MPLNYISANFDDIDSTTSTFKQKVDAFETAMQDIKIAAENLSATWSGSGHDAFQNALDSYSSDMGKMITTLTGMCDALHQSNLAYQDTDSSVHKGFTAL